MFIWSVGWIFCFYALLHIGRKELLANIQKNKHRVRSQEILSSVFFDFQPHILFNESNQDVKNKIQKLMLIQPELMQHRLVRQAVISGMLRNAEREYNA